MNHAPSNPASPVASPPPSPDARAVADQMRQRRFDRAERLANEAPVKLLFPLMLFIFPCVFIILLGPILQQSVGRLF